MTVRRLVLVVAALAVVVLAGAAAASASSGSGDVVALQAGDGAAIYQANCASCHQADGSGVAGAFPPLAGNPAAADADYVRSVVVEGLSGPLEVLGESYNSVMPAVALSDGDLDALVEYVATFAGGPTPTTPPTTAGPTTGDAAKGESLFKGSGFANGGAACQACHAAGPIGFRGGSGLGPDLTDVHERLGGDAGLAAWLSAPPSPTMRPLFEDKPLTPGEIADLNAFFASVVDEEPGGGIDQLMLGGVIGLGLLLGVMALAASRTRETYTERLRRRS